MKAVCVYVLTIFLAYAIAYPTNLLDELDELDEPQRDEPQGNERNPVLITLVQLVLHKSCFFVCDESMPFLENYVSHKMRVKLGNVCKKLTKHVLTLAFTNKRLY